MALIVPEGQRCGGCNRDGILEAVSASRNQAHYEHSSQNIKMAEVVRSLKDHLSSRQCLLIDTASEKGISSWLTTDPSPHCGSVLNKSDFRDAICIRYGFLLDGLPTMCVCGTDMTQDHVCTCPCGRYHAARHDEIRDVVADVMHDAL